MKQKLLLRDAVLTAALLAAAYLVNLVLQHFFQNLAPTVATLSVFLISLWTNSYLWGILASLVSVLVVNFAFTTPYYVIDFITPENFFSAAVMLIIAVLTGALTTKIKSQEKLKAESERERMRANLLRAVSHDLRTPLTAIYGSTATVVENYDQLSREQHIKLLRGVSEDAQWLIRMVENLLFVTRLDGENIRLKRNPVVLEELIDNVLIKFGKRYPQQAVTVQIPDEFVSILADAMLIEQVLINLLENAVLHAEGMSELLLTVRLYDRWAFFEVADDGCGLPQEKIPRVFSGYWQGDEYRDSHRSGMGIGLSVCAAIIKAHGSSIDASNRPGGGASFRFALEREEEHDEQ